MKNPFAALKGRSFTVAHTFVEVAELNAGCWPPKTNAARASHPSRIVVANILPAVFR